MGGQQPDPASYYYYLQQGQRELGEPLLSDRGRWNGPQDLPPSVTDDLLLNLDLFRHPAAASAAAAELGRRRFQSLPRSLSKSASRLPTDDRPILQDLLINNETRLNEALLLEHRLRQQKRQQDRDRATLDLQSRLLSRKLDSQLLGKAGASAAELDLLRRRAGTYSIFDVYSMAWCEHQFKL